MKVNTINLDTHVLEREKDDDELNFVWLNTIRMNNKLSSNLNKIMFQPFFFLKICVDAATHTYIRLNSNSTSVKKK